MTTAGQVITYTYTVKNTGVTPLTGVFLTDTDNLLITLASGDTNKDGKYNPTETWTYTATHTVTMAEIIAGTPLIDTTTVYSSQSAVAARWSSSGTRAG